MCFGCCCRGEAGWSRIGDIIATLWREKRSIDIEGQNCIASGGDLQRSRVPFRGAGFDTGRLEWWQVEDESRSDTSFTIFQTIRWLFNPFLSRWLKYWMEILAKSKRRPSLFSPLLPNWLSLDSQSSTSCELKIRRSRDLALPNG